MIKNMYKKIILFLLAIIIISGVSYLAYWPIIKTEPEKIDSGVEGIVTLGPTCPVMREGDLSCADKPYATTIQAIAMGSPKSSFFTTVESDKEGKYKITLPPGEYALQPVGGSVMPRCETKNITIKPSEILKINLSCDTGIR